jgi:DNA-binding NtrC family response regulator
MTETVLFVDDDPALLAALRRALRHERYDILSAGSAEEAVRVLERRPVAVVVSDDNMPGIRGCDFLSQIRHLFPGTIRIMLTGHATPEAMAQAVNEGQLFRYLAKPCAHATLAEAVRQALDQYALFARCRELLRLIRRQNQVLERLSGSQPALVRKAVETTTDLAVGDADFDNAADLAACMAVEIRQGSGLFPVQAG